MAKRERWKWIEGYEGRYEVSDRGRVRSYLYPGGSEARRSRPVILSPTYSNRGGRPRVTLTFDGETSMRFVAHLVLETFIGPRPAGKECCHEDDDFDNNQVENLRWDTHKANCSDAKRNGKQARGERQGMSKLKEAQVLELYRLRHEEDVPYDDLMARFGVSIGTVNKIVTGKTWAWLTGHGRL